MFLSDLKTHQIKNALMVKLENVVNVPSTPLIAEKPFISFENDKYYLEVPLVE